eukprot:TRINITY_DN4739_c0_g1_i3.p1 TRINITY_DN4739_c0_g1~~TRINITY_DN4739_c0_g1_i3.p1  ORF type:complete len:1187 (-),score=273.56 TRINITY_DN4739_c0_g1_i3:761-4321(-)
MEEEGGISGPWRATKLWNDIIRNFRSGMPLKKHKKNLKTYDSCFTSTEAIDWLHRNLQKNPNFGTDVSKEQTIQLLKKLYRAGIIENVREDVGEEEFRVSGELYRFNNKSPVRNLRTPGKENRKPLADTANTPRRDPIKNNMEVFKPEREKSANRKAKEEMKKQLNLSYFQGLPSNSLIILDNDDTWRKVFMAQLSRIMTSKHTEKLDYAGQLDMDNVMHNMTKVSAKGIVQVEDKSEDLPHWVLSAMKCLANWPKQLRTVNGEESCLPNYAGFENDVFNVVKDYFLGLQSPLTTFTLYEFLVEGYQRAEGKIGPPTAPKPSIRTLPGFKQNHGSANKACTRPFPQTNEEHAGLMPDTRVHQNARPLEGEDSCFYRMTDSVEDFALLTNKERVAKIRQTFQVLPPLATSSLQNSNNTSSSLSGHSTFDAISPSTISPRLPSTSMQYSLPPKTCYETAFVDTSPITRIVPQKEHEVLHIKRSWSGRSLLHIPTSDWTRSTSTQTDTDQPEQDRGAGNSLKRIPKWKRTTRFRKSIAVMETQKNRKAEPCIEPDTYHGLTNHGFVDTPGPAVSMCPTGNSEARFKSMSALKQHKATRSSSKNIRGFSSVDNLLDKEKEFEEEFMLKYRQVSGDLRGSCDLVQASRQQQNGTNSSDDSRYLIHSKTLRKEKKKRRYRAHSEDKYGGYATDSEIMYDSSTRSRVHEVNERYWQLNRSFDTSPTDSHKQSHPNLLAPLAMDETTDLSPVVPFTRNNKFNNSYRLATNQPATPVGRSMLPRTSTRLELQHHEKLTYCKEDIYGRNRRVDEVPEESGSIINARAEPYINSDSSVCRSVCTGSKDRHKIDMKVSNSGTNYLTYNNNNNSNTENRYGTVHRSSTNFKRNTESRLSRCSQATVDSGRYSDVSSSTRVSASQPTLQPQQQQAPQAHQGGLYVLPCNSVAAVPMLNTNGTINCASSLPAKLLTERLKQLPPDPIKVEENAIDVFKLLTLLVPPSKRRKLQLLLKFIRKVSLNHELKLSSECTNREFSMSTFTTVILRPSDPYAAQHAWDNKIVNLFIDRYEQIWSPPESLRREVEDKVYRSLVNRRLEAGEDPYPITYCKQVTRHEYEQEKLTGAEAGLMDLLEAMLADTKMTERERCKKLKKFKESYPLLWRRKFPTEESQPDLAKEAVSKINKFSSLSRIKSRMGM